MSAARAIHRTQERRVERERRRKVAGAIGATAIGTAVLAPGAAADTFTVTNLNDSGAPAGPPGSFRRAVDNANNNPGLDQVVFQSSLSGVLALNRAVYIYQGVEIAGPGANQVALDGQGADRILSLYGLPAGNRRVAVSDLTLQNGYADYGGAIYAPRSSLTLADTNITDNTAAYYGGGAVYARRSTITIARSTITGNTATGSGGGVYSRNSSLTLSASNLTYNSSDGGYGGGIYATGSTIAIADSNVTHNTA